MGGAGGGSEKESFSRRRVQSWTEVRLVKNGALVLGEIVLVLAPGALPGGGRFRAAAAAAGVHAQRHPRRLPTRAEAAGGGGRRRRGRRPRQRL